MNTTTPERSEWIAYDASCGFCLGSVRCFRRFLARHGFFLVPLQNGWVKKRLGINGDELPEEMKALLADGSVRGGVDCLLMVCSRVWWLKPIAAMGRLSVPRTLLSRFYSGIARNRHCLIKRPSVDGQRHHRSAAFFELP